MERDHQTTLPVVLITWCLSVGSISRTLAGEFQVIGSPQPIVALAGDDVILPCSLEPPFNITAETVVWVRPDLDPLKVLVYRRRRYSVEDQNPSYINRTSLFKEELINGNVSLKLSRVKLEDQGNYTCLIPTYSEVKEAVIQLTVVPVSEPKISILGVYNAGVVLQCEAKSLYPEPKLEWREGPKDSEGRLLSADVTQTHREPDGRYTVRRSVTVQKTNTNMFTCRVQLMKFNLKTEAEIHVHADKSKDQTFRFGLEIGLLAGVVLGVVGVGVVVLIYRWSKRYRKSPGGKNTPQDKNNCSKFDCLASPQEKKPMRTEDQIP